MEGESWIGKRRCKVEAGIGTDAIRYSVTKARTKPRVREKEREERRGKLRKPGCLTARRSVCGHIVGALQPC